MNIIEQGSGPALVVIPGIHGRWEYIRPAVESLSTSFRVITFPLCDEPSSNLDFNRSQPFGSYVEQVFRALDQSGVERAIVCGISFGGLIALRFAAVHPERTAGLILVSTPGPAWHPRKRHEIYARVPHLFGPLFLVETPWRLRPELAAAFPELGARWRFARLQLRTLFGAPLSLSRMAARARMIATAEVAADCARIVAPTLVVTGERGLDRVVQVDDSSRYVLLIRGARGAVLERTGHLGSITRPAAFAAIVRDFVDRSVRLQPDRTRRVPLQPDGNRNVRLQPDRPEVA